MPRKAAAASAAIVSLGGISSRPIGPVHPLADYTGCTDRSGSPPGRRQPGRHLEHLLFDGRRLAEGRPERFPATLRGVVRERPSGRQRAQVGRKVVLAGVEQVVGEGPGGGVGVEGRFGLPEAIVVGGVPEPSVWAMLIAGFGLVGFQARRRRIAALATTA